MIEFSDTLLLKLAKDVDCYTVNEPLNWCSNEIQRAEKAVGASGLLQARLGEAAKLLNSRE